MESQDRFTENMYKEGIRIWKIKKSRKFTKMIQINKIKLKQSILKFYLQYYQI